MNIYSSGIRKIFLYTYTVHLYSIRLWVYNTYCTYWTAVLDMQYYTSLLYRFSNYSTWRSINVYNVYVCVVAIQEWWQQSFNSMNDLWIKLADSGAACCFTHVAPECSHVAPNTGTRTKCRHVAQRAALCKKLLQPRDLAWPLSCGDVYVSYCSLLRETDFLKLRKGHIWDLGLSPCVW